MNTKIKKIKAVISDLDGTILDTEKMNAIVVRDVLSEYGFSIPIRECRAEYFKTNPVPIMDGLFELLDFLKEQDIKIAICSGSRSDQIRIKLQSAGVPLDYFHTIVGGEMYRESKPHPECYLYSCEKLRVKPQTVLVIEDSDPGVESAYNAGCKVVLVPNDQPNSEQTKKLALCTVKSLREIIPVLREGI